MADNVTLNAGSGGATIKTDDDGTAHWQYVKVAFGADNTQTRVTSAVGLPISDAGGSITVDNGGTFAVQAVCTNAGTFAVQVDGAALTALQLIDNLVLAEDAVHASADPGVQALAVRKATPADLSGADGDYEPLQVSGGRLWVDASGKTLTVGSHDVTNAGTFAVQAAQSGTWNIGTVTAVTAISNALPAGTNNIGDVDVASIAAGDNNIGNVDIVTVPADPFGANADAASATGSISAKLRFIASTGIPITGTVTISGAVTNAGTFVVQENGAALTALQIMDDWDNAASDGASVSGDVAHDSADAGEPVKQGFKASTSLSGITLVANADRTDGFAGVDGVQIVRPHCNLEDIVTGNASNTDGTSTQVIASSGAGVKTYLTSVILTNTSSSNIYVEIKDGNTVKVTIPLPANSGAIFNPPVPIPGTAATAWNFDPSAAATTVYCSAVGFKSKV